VSERLAQCLAVIAQPACCAADLPPAWWPRPRRLAGPEAGGTVPLPRAEQGWLWCFIDWLIYDFCGCLKKEKAMAIFKFLHSFIHSFVHSIIHVT